MCDNKENVNPRAVCGKGAIALDDHILGIIAVNCDNHMASSGQSAISLNNDGCIAGDTNGPDAILGIVAAVLNNCIVQSEGMVGLIPSDRAALDVRAVKSAVLIGINTTHRDLCVGAQGHQK